jgi:hypothetical protein
LISFLISFLEEINNGIETPISLPYCNKLLLSMLDMLQIRPYHYGLLLMLDKIKIPPVVVSKPKLLKRIQ